MNVVCVNWGNKYSPTYVHRLFNMVVRNTNQNLNFFCLTDKPEQYAYPMKVVKLNRELTGWWNKMLMFKKGVLPIGEYLYFDLDVVIVDKIDQLWAHQGFGITRDFVRPFEGLLGGPEYNSSVMKFTQSDDLWEFFTANSSLWREAQQQVPYFGDQNVISAFLNHHSFSNPFPDEWIWSYKAGVKRGGFWNEGFLGTDIPKNGKVCVFHGKPNPSEVDAAWVSQHWC
jgi:hypothetical protein